MKCLCGYEHLEDQEDPFHPIVFSDGSEYGNTVYAYIQREGQYNNLLKDVYACPKCGTLKIIF